MTLHDDDPATVSWMLIFLYTDDYPTTEHSQVPTTNCVPSPASFPRPVELNEQPLSIHAAMYGIGDKYDLASLRDLSRAKYIQALSSKSSVADFTNSVEVAYATMQLRRNGARAI